MQRSPRPLVLIRKVKGSHRAELHSGGTKTDEDTRDGAVRILREDILTMGATADQSHLPALVKVLAARSLTFVRRRPMRWA